MVTPAARAPSPQRRNLVSQRHRHGHNRYLRRHQHAANLRPALLRISICKERAWLNLNIGGGGVFSPGGNWNGFAGTINLLTGNWIREMDTVTFGSANAVWNFGSNGGLYNKWRCHHLPGGVVRRHGRRAFRRDHGHRQPHDFVVGGVNTNSVFNGTISDGGAAATALVFNGPGSLTLTGNNTSAAAPPSMPARFTSTMPPAAAPGPAGSASTAAARSVAMARLAGRCPSPPGPRSRPAATVPAR
jgi:hypothetical protein